MVVKLYFAVQVAVFQRVDNVNLWINFHMADSTVVGDLSFGQFYLPFDQLGLKIQKDYNIVVLAMKALPHCQH